MDKVIDEIRKEINKLIDTYKESLAVPEESGKEESATLNFEESRKEESLKESGKEFLEESGKESGKEFLEESAAVAREAGELAEGVPGYYRWDFDIPGGNGTLEVSYYNGKSNTLPQAIQDVEDFLEDFMNSIYYDFEDRVRGLLRD